MDKEISQMPDGRRTHTEAWRKTATAVTSTDGVCEAGVIGLDLRVCEKDARKTVEVWVEQEQFQ